MTAEPEGTATWALAYASGGWPVFPCQPGSKEPATRHGFHDATTDPAQIRRWWDRLPAANLAIAAGLPGPDVLDVDERGAAGNGFAAYHRLNREGLLGGAGAVVATPGGGLHVYFAGSSQGSGRLAGHHLDFKASGGYVLAPPSQVSGKPYRVISGQAASGVLDWAAAVSLLDPERHRLTLPSRLALSDVGRLAAWVEGLGEGNRNSGLFWAACRAVEAGEPGQLDELAAAAARAGLDDREIARTMASARRTIQGTRASSRTGSHTATGRPGLGRGVYAELDGIPQAAGQARALARDLLGTGHPSVNDAALILSELVSNSVTHSRSGRDGGTLAIAVEMAPGPGDVHIKVRDAGGPHAPAQAEPGPDSEHGRGLAIVTALAAEWGTQTSPAGRSTWCRLKASPRPDATDRSPEREAG